MKLIEDLEAKVEIGNKVIKYRAMVTLMEPLKNLLEEFEPMEVARLEEIPRNAENSRV